jgi:S1-C subfamily serine protease
MNKEFRDFHRNSLKDVIELLGEPFTYKGTVYYGAISQIETSNQLNDDGGLLPAFGTSIVIEKSKMPTVPISGEVLYIDGTKGRIIKVDKDFCSITLFVETGKK